MLSRAKGGISVAEVSEESLNHLLTELSYIFRTSETLLEHTLLIDNVMHLLVPSLVAWWVSWYSFQYRKLHSQGHFFKSSLEDMFIDLREGNINWFSPICAPTRIKCAT